MRPLRLIMSAFGPYCGEQAVDFRRLGGRNFFLIHGPTGGGKTTILDAICYALYGDTSGHERTGEQMRSDMASPLATTFVTFDFSIGAKRYRVTRSPEQHRLKKRGGGTTTQDATATLWDRTDAADDGEDGAVLASQTTRVTQKVEELLGFQSEQFRQVIVLPQGQFRQLLMADSVEREAILQTLFQTSFYEQVQEALKERARAVVDRVKEKQRQQEMLLQQAQATTLAELLDRRKAKDDELQTVKATMPGLRQTEEDAGTKLTEAMQVEAKLKERDEADRKLRELEVQEQAMGAKRASLDAARRAASLAADEAVWKQRHVELKQRQLQHPVAHSAFNKAQQDARVAGELLKKQEAMQPELEKLRGETIRLEQLAERVKRIETAQRDAKSAEEKFAAIEKLHKSEQTAFEPLARQLEEKKVKLAAAQRQAAAHDGNVLAFDQLTRQLQDRTKIEAIRRQVADQQRRHATLTQQIQSSSRQLENQKRSLVELQNAWTASQAAILAKDLAPGQPCPVCGSLVHPALAPVVGELPSKEHIERKRGEIDTGELALNKLRDDFQKTAEELARFQTSERELSAALGESIAEPIAKLEDQLRQCRAAMDGSQRAKDSIPALEKDVNETVAAVEVKKSSLDRLDADQRKAAEVAAQARAARDECIVGVPENLRSQLALDGAHKAAASRVQQIEDDIKAARSASGEADKRLSAAHAAFVKSKEELDQATAAAAQARAAFEAKRQQAGFASNDEYKAAKLEDVQIRQLEQQIGDYERARSAARDRRDRATSAAEGLVMPDLPALRAALDEAKRKLESANRRDESLHRDIEGIDRIAAALKEAAAAEAAFRNDYAVIGGLAEVSLGKNAAGMTFQRFVLAFLLDDVLLAATQRLRIMSRGRYQLQRRRERTDMRAHSGLDLEVFDTYTGSARPVATLSGGESFLASLSLALGLADVVQTYAGGIRLETMFIDEGFGSLDSEAMDLAIRSLQDLLGDGRLVGIISHVPELRERIDARLEIRSGRSGSTAEFVTPENPLGHSISTEA